MADVVLWFGPIGPDEVAGAGIPGVKSSFWWCHGSKVPWCPQMGQELQNGSLSVQRTTGVSPLDHIYIGAYSAGGSVVKRMLMRDEYLDKTIAVHLADATYTSGWVDAKERLPVVEEGFMRYALDVASSGGSKLLVATASPIPNGQWASGHENLRAMAAAIEKETGRAFVKRSDFFGVVPLPTEVLQLGNIVFALYPEPGLGHRHQKLAKQVWEKIIQPWSKTRTPLGGAGSANLADGTTIGVQAGGTTARAAWFVGSVVVAYAVSRALM